MVTYFPTYLICKTYLWQKNGYQGDNHGQINHGNSVEGSSRFIHNWVVNGAIPLWMGTLTGSEFTLSPLTQCSVGTSTVQRWTVVRLCTECTCRIPILIHKSYAQLRSFEWTERVLFHIYIEGSNVGNVGRTDKCGLHTFDKTRLAHPNFLKNNNNSIFLIFFLGALTPKLSWLRCKCCKLREGPISFLPPESSKGWAGRLDMCLVP